MRIPPSFRSSMLAPVTVFVTLLLTVGCVTAPPSSPSKKPSPPKLSVPFSAGGAALFLNLAGAPPNLEFTLEEIAFRQQGQWSLQAAQLHFAPAAGQRFLGWLPASGVEAVRLRFGPGRLAGRLLNPSPTQTVLPLPNDPRNRRLLFLDIDLRSARDREFSPLAHLRIADRRLERDLLFVACSTLDTIYIVRTDTNEVIDALPVTGGPSRLAVLPERSEMLVLCRRRGEIARIDLDTGQERNRYPVPLLTEVRDMALAPDHAVLYCIGDDNLLVALDPRTGVLLGRQRLGRDLIRLTLHPVDGRLAIAAAGSHEIFLVDGQRLQPLTTIPTNGPPFDLLFTDDKLVVSERSSQQISSYGANGRELDRRPLAVPPARLAADHNFLYVGTGNGITILNRQSLAVSARIPIQEGVTGDLLVEPTRRWLYAIVPQQGGIVVIDSTSRLRRTSIALGTQADDLALLE